MHVGHLPGHRLVHLPVVPDIHLASPQPFRGAGTRSFSLGHLATREKLPVFEKRLKTALSTLAGEHVYVVVFPGISPYAEIRIHSCRQTRMHLTNTGLKAMTFLPSVPRTGRRNVAAVTPESGTRGARQRGRRGRAWMPRGHPGRGFAFRSQSSHNGCSGPPRP